MLDKGLEIYLCKLLLQEDKAPDDSLDHTLTRCQDGQLIFPLLHWDVYWKHCFDFSTRLAQRWFLRRTATSFDWRLRTTRRWSKAKDTDLLRTRSRIETSRDKLGQLAIGFEHIITELHCRIYVSLPSDVYVFGNIVSCADTLIINCISLLLLSLSMANCFAKGFLVFFIRYEPK